MPLEIYPIAIYGEMYQFDQSNVISIGAQDTWYEIGGMTEGETQEVTFQNAKEFKILRPGKYQVKWNLCWTDGVGTTYKFRLAINGTTVGKTQGCGRKGNATDIISSSSNAILDLAEDDIVTLEVLNATNTNNIQIIDANINLYHLSY